jgi:Fe-S-cluster containining protein
MSHRTRIAAFKAELKGVDLKDKFSSAAEEIAWIRKELRERNPGPNDYNGLVASLMLSFDEVLSKVSQYCNMCGLCCKFFTKVWLCDADNPLIDMMSEEMKSKYLGRTDGKLTFNIEHNCPFQKDNKCDVYEVRSRACRLWPAKRDSLGVIGVDLIPGCEAALKIIEDDWNYRQHLKNQGLSY